MRIAREDLRSVSKKSDYVLELVRVVSMLSYTTFFIFMPVGLIVAVPYNLIIGFAIGLVLVLLNRSLIVDSSFRVVYWLRTVADKVNIVALPMFLLTVAILAVFPEAETYPTPLKQSIPVLVLGSFEALGLGVVTKIFGDVFYPSSLTALCFRQAVESKGYSKIQWIRFGVGHLREVVSIFDLELDGKLLQHILAIRLLARENIDSDLVHISDAISKGESFLPLLERLEASHTDSGFIRTKKGVKDRLLDYLRSSTLLANLFYLLVASLIALSQLGSMFSKLTGV